jgi:hypothetical protein
LKTVATSTEAVVVEIYINSEGTHRLPPDVSELPLITIEILSEDNLAELIKRANSSTDAPSEYPSLKFCSIPVAGVRRLASFPDAVVSQDGRMKWPGYPFAFERITQGDLERAQQFRFFDGDPRAYILDQYVTVGNGGFYSTWSELIAFLRTAGEAGAGVTFIGATVILTKRIAGRALTWIRQRTRRRHPTFDPNDAIRHLGTLLQTTSTTWIAQGAASPTVFLASIAKYESWDSSTLTQLLACDELSISKMLEALGYERVDGSRFKISDDPRRLECRRSVLGLALFFDPLTLEELPRAEGST